MIDPTTFLGLRTAVYHVRELGAATQWYAIVLRTSPYIDTPYYVGFNVGGFEFGLHPLDSDSVQPVGNAVAYWGVPDVAATLDWLLTNGATTAADILDVGGGIQIAAVNDPFGNRLGIIENPTFPNSALPMTNGGQADR